VIELRYFGGPNREEITESLGLTLATVKRDLAIGSLAAPRTAEQTRNGSQVSRTDGPANPHRTL